MRRTWFVLCRSETEILFAEAHFDPGGLLKNGMAAGFSQRWALVSPASCY
jgi:hypothetical protein